MCIYIIYIHIYIYVYEVKVLVVQLCLTFCDPMNCSLPSSSVHGILQVRMLEWIAMPFSKGSSLPRDRTQVSHIAGGFFTVWAQGSPYMYIICVHRQDQRRSFSAWGFGLKQESTRCVTSYKYFPKNRMEEVSLFILLVATSSSYCQRESWGLSSVFNQTVIPGILMWTIAFYALSFQKKTRQFVN